MVKIKVGLFESIACCTLMPQAGALMTTLVAIIALIGKQFKQIAVYIGIAYAACVAILVISLLICSVYYHFNRNELQIDSDKIIYKEKEYLIADIYSCTYYECRWYAIPFIYFYKQQLGGTFVISFEEEDIIVQIRYCDYLKIKNLIPGINKK